MQTTFLKICVLVWLLERALFSSTQKDLKLGQCLDVDDMASKFNNFA